MPRSLLAICCFAWLLAACGQSKAACDGGCGCAAPSDCPSGQSCVAGFCAAAQACTTDLDCSNPADICVSGSCVPGTADAGPTHADAGAPDAGHHDGGADAGRADGGTDAGSDSGIDAGPDAGTPDAGTPDAGVDAGPTGDAGSPDGGCTATSGCTPPMICCNSGACTPGTCILPGGCSSDSQCNPPALICDQGSCVQGCLAGACDAGARCDAVFTGRCQPATGNGAPGASCQSFSDCAATPTNSNSGDCLPLLLPDGGVQAFCTFACQGTSQCPTGYACALFGGGGQCVPQGLAGVSFGSGAIGSACTGSATCDSFEGCGPYATGGDVCSDGCLGPSSEVCPNGWECNDVTYFTNPLDGGPTCSKDSDCTKLSPDALCFIDSPGGGNECYLALQADACFEKQASDPTETTPSTCTGDTGCQHGFCYQGRCADPCCSAADCPQGYACAPVVEQQFSILMACISSAGSGKLGAACDPSAATNPCRAQLSTGQGLCLSVDGYSNSSDAGYCSDYCCDDAQCGAGYTCSLAEIGTDTQGNGLFANACLKL